ncbi:MAG TPA: hemolysin family protein [Savagea sp.]
MTAFAVLIMLTAFFVAAEFAIVKVRSTRIDQLVEEGHKKAHIAKKILQHLDEYLSACQLGITMTALGLGMLGEPTVRMLLQPLFDATSFSANTEVLLSFIIAFTVVTFLHVVLGELAPKTIAIQKAEEITLLFAKPLHFFYILMYPLIKILNGSAQIIIRLFGFKVVSEQDSTHTEEELRMILSDSFKSGEINHSEFEFVNKIFEFDDRIAKEIMVPRTEMTTIDHTFTLNDVFEVIGVEQFTRYPVIEGDKDNVIGLVNMKHLLTAYIKDPNAGSHSVTQYVQPIIHAIETMPIGDLLLKIQRERIHMVILVDEYGGTSGLVTIEDILEEIVGEIQDEFDTHEVPEIRVIGENHFIFDAKVLIDEVNDILAISIDENDIDTIGGWFMSQHFESKPNEKIIEQDYEFSALDVSGHHISYVEAKKITNLFDESSMK